MISPKTIELYAYRGTSASKHILFKGGPVKFIANLDASIDLTGCSSLRLDIRESATDTDNPLATEEITSFEGNRYEFEFSTAQTNQLVTSAWLVLSALYLEGSGGIDDNLDPLYIAEITFIPHNASMLAPNPPDASVVLTQTQADERYLINDTTTSSLLGRYSSGSGDFEVISIGSNLSLSGSGVLSAEAGLDSSEGGNGSSDFGKAALFDPDGALTSSDFIYLYAGDGSGHVALSLAPFTGPKNITIIGENGTLATREWVNASYAGSSAVTTVGTITSGSWNGTVGATTPSTGVFTTITASGAVTMSANGAASAPAVNITGVPFAGTGTTSFPLVYINETGATASTTLSTAGTLFGVNGNGTADLMNLLTDGVSKFRVDSSGGVTVGSTGQISSGIYVGSSGSNGLFRVDGNTATRGVGIGSLCMIAWASGAFTGTSVTGDTYLGRQSAANLRQGAADAASPVSQTFSVQNVATGTSNTAGAARYIDGSQSTGAAAGGSIVFRTSPASGSTGSAQNALAAALTIASSGAITTSHGVTATRSFTAGSAYGFTWQGKTVIASPTNGTIRLTNAAESIGATIDVTTADTFKFRDRTNAADAAITAGTITATGVISTASNLEAGPSAQIIFASRSKLRSAVDGNIQLGNFGNTDFGLLQFGGTTSSFPSIKRNGAVLNFRLADDSADCDVTAAKTTLSGPLITTPQALSGAGAVNITTGATAFTSTGAAQALTLADGTNGQIKTIVHVSDGGSGVLTPTTKSGYTTITFTNIGDSVTLQFFTGAGWCIIGIFGAVAA